VCAPCGGLWWRALRQGSHSPRPVAVHIGSLSKLFFNLIFFFCVGKFYFIFFFFFPVFAPQQRSQPSTSHVARTESHSLVERFFFLFLLFRFGIYHVPHSQTDRDKKQTRNPTETGEDRFSLFFFSKFLFLLLFSNFEIAIRKKRNKFVCLIYCGEFQCRPNKLSASLEKKKRKEKKKKIG
jgi:hypothetical protein